jgi:6-phosphogluconolactonase
MEVDEELVVPDPERGLVYVTVRGSDVVAVIDPAAGALLRTVPCGGAWPRAAALDADGSLLVACQHSGEVRRIDPTGVAAPEVVWRLPDVACVVPVA